MTVDPTITLSIISTVGILIGAIAYVIKNKLTFVKCFCCKSDCREKRSSSSLPTPTVAQPRINISEV